MSDFYWFCFWLLLCGLVATFAHKKGRSPTIAFIASVIASPFLIALVVLIIPRKVPKDKLAS